MIAELTFQIQFNMGQEQTKIERQHLVQRNTRNYHEKWMKEIEGEIKFFNRGLGFKEEKCELIKWCILREIEKETIVDFVDARKMTREKLREVMKNEQKAKSGYKKL